MTIHIPSSPPPSYFPHCHITTFVLSSVSLFQLIDTLSAGGRGARFFGWGCAWLLALSIDSSRISGHRYLPNKGELESTRNLAGGGLSQLLLLVGTPMVALAAARRLAPALNLAWADGAQLISLALHLALLPAARKSGRAMGVTVAWLTVFFTLLAAAATRA